MPEVKDRCPDCHEPCGAPTLLTSMVRYYSCARCGRSWRVVRDLQVERWPSDELVSLLERRSSPSVKLLARVPSGDAVPRQTDSRRWDDLNAWANRRSLRAFGRSSLVHCTRVVMALQRLVQQY